MKTIDIESIKTYFKAKANLSAKEFYEYFRKNEPELKASTFRWRLYSMKQSGLIHQIKRDCYTFETQKTPFKPLLDEKINKISKIYLKKYPELNYCIWSSAWLHDYMIQQPANYFYIFETEKDILDSCFHLFRDNKINVFIQPDYNQMINYVSQNVGNVILKPIISRSPVRNIDKIKIPAIEKILVDIFCDYQTFYFYQGSELENIFEWCFSKHLVNFSTLQYYAERRKRKEQLIEFLINKIEIEKDILK